MRGLWAAIIAFTCMLAPPIEGNTKLLIELTGTNSSTEEVSAFARRAIAFSNDTNITITVDDVNECESLSMNTCSEFAACSNTDGSFTCGCLPGFTDNSQANPGRNCTDVDECDGNHNCSGNATCQNEVGSYSCVCNPGYVGDGSACRDIDECDGNNNCSENAVCQNGIGNYSCICNSGYVGDGWTCQDIDECEGTTNCSQNATCANTNGSYTCTCDIGFTGDGFNCNEILPMTTETSTATSATTASVTSSPITTSTIKSTTASARTDTTTRDSTTSETTETGSTLASATTTEAANLVTIDTGTTTTQATPGTNAVDKTTTVAVSKLTTEENASPSQITFTESTVISRTQVTSHSPAVSRPETSTSIQVTSTIATTEPEVDHTTFADSTTADQSSAPEIMSSSTTTASQQTIVATATASDIDTTASTHEESPTSGTTDAITSHVESTMERSTAEITTVNGSISVDDTSNSSEILAETSTQSKSQIRSTESTTNKSIGLVETDTRSSEQLSSSPTTTVVASDAPNVTESDSNPVNWTNSQAITETAPVQTISNALPPLASTERKSALDSENSSPSDMSATPGEDTTTPSKDTANDVTFGATISTEHDASETAQQDTQTTVIVTNGVATPTPVPPSSTTTSTSFTTSITTTTVTSTSTKQKTVTATTNEPTSESALMEEVNATFDGTTLDSVTTTSTTSDWEKLNVTTMDEKVTGQTNIEINSTQSPNTTVPITENTVATKPEQTSTTAESNEQDATTSIASTTSERSDMKITSVKATIEATTPVYTELPESDDPVELIDSIAKKIANTTSGELKLLPNQANRTISTFEKLLDYNDTITLDENVINTVFDTIDGFANGDTGVDDGQIDPSVGARMTAFVTSLLEVMELPPEGFRSDKATLVLEARDINITDIPQQVDFVPGSSSEDRGIALPKGFIQSATLREGEKESDDTNGLRLAFTEYSDGRLFIDMQTAVIRTNTSYTANDFQNGNQIINSAVIGASVARRNIRNSSEQVTVKLKPIVSESLESSNSNGTVEVVSFTSNPRCVWWDYDTLSWSEDGCELSGSSIGQITCRCDHLTSFAVIMSVEKTVEDPILLYLSYAGAGLSIFGLLWTILTYSIFRSLRKHRSKKLLLHFCSALCGVYITYVLGIAAKLPSNQAQCIVSGFFLHFLTLSVMAWMSVEVFDMYFMFVKVMWHSFHKYMLKAGLIAWLSPFLAALITLGAHLGVPDKGIYPIYTKETVCWLGPVGMLYAFIVPSCILLFTNLILFAIVLYHVTFKRNHSAINRLGKKSTKKVKAGQHIANALALLLLAGPTWIIGYFINIDPVEDGVFRRTLSYVFVLLNAFQGFWIFVVFSVRPLTVRTRWKNLITKGKLSNISTISSTSGSRHTRTTRTASKSPRTSTSPPPRDLSLRSDNSSISCGVKQPVQSSLSSNSSNSDSSNAQSAAPLTSYNVIPVVAIRGSPMIKETPRKSSGNDATNLASKGDEESLYDKSQDWAVESAYHFADSSSRRGNDLVKGNSSTGDEDDAN